MHASTWRSSCLRTAVLTLGADAGAVVAASNAALALVQLGDEQAAIKEMQKASRRAPGSADLRAALAALYWSQVPNPVQAPCCYAHPRHMQEDAKL